MRLSPPAGFCTVHLRHGQIEQDTADFLHRQFRVAQNDGQQMVEIVGDPPARIPRLSSF
jgi:hypothetical protein